MYEGHEDIPDGVYTDNVVRKEVLLGRKGDAPRSSTAASTDTTPPTTSAAALQTLPLGNIADAGNSAVETMTEYMDEGSGAPATPRSGNLQQPLDRHGTDDTDENGAVSAQSSATHVTMVGPAVGPELDLTSTPDQLKLEDTQDVQEPTDSDRRAFLADLEQRAKARGVGPSEWHEMRRQPLWQVLISVEALEHPTSPSVGSSS